MKTKLEPKIRFKDSDKEWKIYSFGQLGSVSMNKRIYKDQTFEKGDVPFFKIGTFGSKPDAYITKELFEDYKTRFPYPKKGNILISASGSIGKTVEYDGKDAYFQDSNIIWLEHNDKIDDKFLKHIYSICEWDGLEGSTIKRLYNRNILNTEIIIPEIPEQIKVARVLDNIDQMIKLNQIKHDKIERLRKTLFEKMFPKENDKIPNIRFESFTEDWSKNLYKDIGIPLSGGNLSYESLNSDGNKKCVLYGDLYTKYDCIIKNICNRTFEKGNTIIKNDILFPQSTTVDAYSLISPACLNEDEAETSGVFVIRPNEDINGNFICYYSKGNENQRWKLAKNGQGLTIVHLYYQSIQDETIMIPSKKEQDKIAELFLKMDDLLYSYKLKLDKMKRIKTTMLEKMLV